MDVVCKCGPAAQPVHIPTVILTMAYSHFLERFGCTAHAESSEPHSFQLLIL
jgi:hypothetical protein